MFPPTLGRWLAGVSLALLTACGDSGGDEPVASQPIQSYINCRYERVPGRWIYSCAAVGQCDLTDSCAMLASPDPGCPVGKTTCEACPPGQLAC